MGTEYAKAFLQILSHFKPSGSLTTDIANESNMCTRPTSIDSVVALQEAKHILLHVTFIRPVCLVLAGCTSSNEPNEPVHGGNDFRLMKGQ